MTLPSSVAFRDVIHLSHVLSPEMPAWPGDPAWTVTEWSSLETDGYRLRLFCGGEHTGTHICAPAGFVEGGSGVETYGAPDLVRPAVVIRVAADVQARPNYALSLKRLRRWEQSNGQIPAGTVVLLDTGWAARWPGPEYLNVGAEGRPAYPGFSIEAARWLLDARGVAGLGTDAPGIEPGSDADYSVNRYALSAGALVIECLASLSELPPRGAWLAVGALRIAGGTGAPATVLALVP